MLLDIPVECSLRLLHEHLGLCQTLFISIGSNKRYGLVVARWESKLRCLHVIIRSGYRPLDGVIQLDHRIPFSFSSLYVFLLHAPSLRSSVQYLGSLITILVMLNTTSRLACWWGEDPHFLFQVFGGEELGSGTRKIRRKRYYTHHVLSHKTCFFDNRFYSSTIQLWLRNWRKTEEQEWLDLFISSCRLGPLPLIPLPPSRERQS
jgi:hypothetical protein